MRAGTQNCLKAATTRSTTSVVKVMKITALILLTACLHAVAAGHAQQKISLSERNAPVQKIFNEIRKQTGYQFLYANQIIAAAKPVTIQVKDALLEEVLLATFKDQPLEYEIKDKVIIVRGKANDKSVTTTDNSPAHPPVDIRGRIVNENGQPLAGASVKIKGSDVGTSTDAEGRFTLNNVDENAMLEVSYVGYDAQLIPVKGKSLLAINLQPKSSNTLDETVVIAYGTTTRRLSTGNVSSVKASDIEKQPVNNPLLALQGRVPGLFITQSTGLPGTGVTVRIQGQNSILKGNDPLYVVDGVPVISQLLPTSSASILGTSGGTILNGIASGSGNPLTYLNPADIESIDVLKDADATAIYGSRAANGAILITTKKGKSGQTKVDINVQRGFGKVTRKLDLLNTKQYLEMRREGLKNDNAVVLASNYDINGTWDTTKNTDWQKELIGGTAQYNNIQAGISGGNNTTQFLVGAGFHKETTVFPGDLSDTKGSLHFNINNSSSNQRFKFQISGSYLLDNNRLQNQDLTSVAMLLAPNAPNIFNNEGSLNWAPIASGSSTVSTWKNPLSYLENKYQNKSNNIISNSIISYQLASGFEIRSSLGYNRIEANEISTFPLMAIAPELRTTSQPIAMYANGAVNTWIIEPQLSYNKKISEGSLNTLIGTTLQNVNSNRQEIMGIGYNSDAILEDVKSASSLVVLSTLKTVYKYNALYGRVNYNWKGRYLVDLNWRKDGSSRFGSQNLFHNFGSIGAAWIFSEERFVKEKIHFLSFGKIKASYGTTGNDQIGDYQFMNLYSVPSNVGSAYGGRLGLEPKGVPNPYLQWEKTKKVQIGLDIGLFNERILLNITNYYNTSSNELLTYNLPRITGFSNISSYNFPAIIRNTGWEISLNTKNIKNKNIRWSTNFNLTIPRNKLVAFESLSTSAYANTFVIGKPITAAKAYRFMGVDPSTGIYMFANKNGDAVFTPNSSTDKITTVNRAPTFYGGFENSISYHEISLDFLVQFVKQIGPNYLFGNNPGYNNQNQPIYVFNRWQKPGDNTQIQKYSSGSNVNITSANLNAIQSDAAYSDASFIRFKNISLSWHLLKNWEERLHLNNAKIYVQGQNVFTITKYKGLDPENQSVYSLPPLRVITFGLQVGI